MPRPHITMRRIRDVLRLSLGEHKLSLRQVGLATAIPHTTVADYLRRAQAAGLSWPLSDDLDDDALEALLFPSGARQRSSERPLPDFEWVHREYRRPGVTLMLLWDEYRRAHPDDGYGYTQFCDHYHRWRRHLDVTMRQSHKAGEKLFVDFPGMQIPIYESGRLTVAFRAELFVAAMGASSLVYAEATRSQELLYWVTAHVHSFEWLGSLPQIVVPDNLRSSVTKAHRYEPEVNRTYAEMAEHYGVAVIPARPYKSRDKAKAEVSVQIAERWIIARLRNEHFTSLGEANGQIRELVGWINDRPFKKLPGTRRSVFESLERPVMRPLPETRYEFATWRSCKLAFDYHVSDSEHGHYYSAPYRLAGERVEVRTSAATVEVFHRHRRVASHKRSFTPGFTTDPAHMPESHRRYAKWTPGRIVAWANKAGPSVGRLVEEILATRRHPEQGFRSCLGIIRLGEKYSTDRLEAACARALALRSYSYKSVESILSHGLDRQPLNQPTPSTHPPHRNLRGAGYYR
jgi:transposase